MSKLDQLGHLINSNNFDQYEVIGSVMQEALRFMSPAGGTTVYEFLKDLTVGKYNFQKGDKFAVVFHLGLHYNTSQWPRPTEFLPERFDPHSPMYLTPDGKKRNGYAYMPFSGG